MLELSPLQSANGCSTKTILSEFSFAPAHLLDPFLKDKEDHPINMAPCNYQPRVDLSISDDDRIVVEFEESFFGPWRLSHGKCLARNGWPKQRDRRIAGKLFCHMTNFVAAQYGWHTGGNLMSSEYLCVEQTQDQIDLLNPTPRDVQLGAIIDQCSGKSAKK